MAELELVRVAQDGASLVLRDPGGTVHTLPITDALRAAVAATAGSPPVSATAAPSGNTAPRTTPADGGAPGGTPPTPAGPGTTDLTPMRPRDLQARLRAGATAEELAAQSGLPVDSVRRYEWPVITEREHVISAVRGHDVAGLDSTRELGEVADARLAARGVTPHEATWTARREGSAPWVVEVRFSAGDRDRSARWTFDLRGRLVTPLDDEARWLSQPDDPLSPDVRAVPSLTTRRAAGVPADDATALLLDDLAGRRGHRTPGRAHRPPTSPLPVVTSRTPAPAAGSDDDGGFEMVPLGALPISDRADRVPARGRRSPAARTADTDTDTDTDTDASVIDIGRWNPRQTRGRSLADTGPGASQPEKPTASGTATEDASPPGERETPEDSPGANRAPAPARPGSPATRRRGRAQVPSWDEIVFGARPEPG